jgi:hypothetical protein
MASSSVIIEFAKIFLGVLVLVLLLLLEQRPTFGVVSSVLFCHRMRGFVVDRHPSAAAIALARTIALDPHTSIARGACRPDLTATPIRASFLYTASDPCSN